MQKYRINLAFSDLGLVYVFTFPIHNGIQQFLLFLMVNQV